jgi:hypothetical protein|tara:strand:+ start:1371 stop:1733 length:363 start_codon:yes stop_codon:yes gene_type:complete
MAYAVGKRAQAQCDRCGFVYKYLMLKTEWNGLKTCLECYEPKHPQLKPIRVPVDPQALKQPRPTEAAPTTSYGIVRTENTVNSQGVTGLSMNPVHNNTIGSSFDMDALTSSLGVITVNTG